MKSVLHLALFEKLMEGVTEQSKGDEVARRVYEASAHEDINKIEPTIRKLLADRDEELRTKMLCGHPIVLMELLPFAEQPEGAVMPTDCEHFKIINPEKLAYRCSACHREKLFVRALVEHVRKRVLQSEPIERMVDYFLAQGRRASA